jgi:endonuclease-3 related protein
MTAAQDRKPGTQSFSTPTSSDQLLREIYDRLWAAYGPQRWWPADSPIEVVVGAILTQNTAWTNVERAINNLKGANCLSWSALRDVTRAELAKLIQPSGTFRVKATRLKAFVGVLWSEYNGSLDSLLHSEIPIVRRRLLAIHGIGPETADAILLYVSGYPIFVIDAYTRRILRRHNALAANVGYKEVQACFHRALPDDPQVYNEYHALLVAVGKKHCRARALCEGCPLGELPHDPEL